MCIGVFGEFSAFISRGLGNTEEFELQVVMIVCHKVLVDILHESVTSCAVGRSIEHRIAVVVCIDAVGNDIRGIDVTCVIHDELVAVGIIRVILVQFESSINTVVVQTRHEHLNEAVTVKISESYLVIKVFAVGRDKPAPFV